MKVHLIPSIFNEYSNVDVELIDLSFPELDLVLKQGIDVVVGRPYPNKCIDVVRRKEGRKAINGILVEIPNHIKSFTLVTRWSVDAERVLTHTVNYNLIDSDYDFASQDPTLWYATCDGSQENRMPVNSTIPCNFNARMRIIFNEKNTNKEGNFIDEYQGNMLVSRIENYPLPTIKEAHLYGRYNLHLKRMPNINDAFQLIESKG
ncbi:DUF6012 family protein [uncultured Shewanella sp.]|uniref:DUF6012 family protein n=1 Tax=uncultured Shewanella sp. TaxID=173975 RepID=UPI00261AF402|nr:DUF6012 family protein [uncultured Shewanella sp.]